MRSLPARQSLEEGFDICHKMESCAGMGRKAFRIEIPPSRRGKGGSLEFPRGEAFHPLPIYDLAFLLSIHLICSVFSDELILMALNATSTAQINFN